MPARKPRRRGQPHKVLHLTTYDRLEEYLRLRPGALPPADPRRRRRSGQKPLRPGRARRQGVLDRGQRHSLRHVRQALPAPRPVRRHRRCRCPLRRPERSSLAQMPVPDRGCQGRGLALRRCAAWNARGFRGSSPPGAGSSSSPTTGRHSTRTWRRSRTAGMCSCSSRAPRRFTPRRGSRMRKRAERALTRLTGVPPVVRPLNSGNTLPESPSKPSKPPCEAVLRSTHPPHISCSYTQPHT